MSHESERVNAMSALSSTCTLETSHLSDCAKHSLLFYLFLIAIESCVTEGKLATLCSNQLFRICSFFCFVDLLILISVVFFRSARKDGCNNAEWPDSYGHYREWKFTQTKHHYAWKLAYTFDQLRVLSNYSGPVILLEDDHFVSEDLLHFATLTNAFRKE